MFALIMYFIFAGFGAQGASITGFDLKSCGAMNCVRLTAKEADVATLSSLVAFARATLQVINRKSGKTTAKIVGEDVFYDPVAERIYLTTLHRTEGSSAYYDLINERLLYFK